jgi:hypothetical protein
LTKSLLVALSIAFYYVSSIFFYKHLFINLGKQASFISSINNLKSQKFYSSSFNDLSKIYNPSIITHFMSSVTEISFYIGSLSAWSKDGNLIGNDLWCFNYNNFYLNLWRSNVNGAPRLLIPY